VSQETITQILAIEEQAVQIHDDARRQADHVTAEAKKTATSVREQTLDKIVAEGQHTAEVTRGRIIAQAEAEAQHMENVAAQHLDRAVSFVLDQIAGRE
jgi:vacuolar-type H+-ATPase subunit H